MTIDDLAIATQQEFQAIRSEMATKEELKETKTEILRAVEALDVHLSAYASRSSEDIAKLQESVQELDGRVRVLEKQK
jgi:predicted RecB family endonuclease